MLWMKLCMCVYLLLGTIALAFTTRRIFVMRRKSILQNLQCIVQEKLTTHRKSTMSSD